MTYDNLVLYNYLQKQKTAACILKQRKYYQTINVPFKNIQGMAHLSFLIDCKNNNHQAKIARNLILTSNHVARHLKKGLIACPTFYFNSKIAMQTFLKTLCNKIRLFYFG